MAQKSNEIPKSQRWFFADADRHILEDKEALIEYHFADALTVTLTMFKYNNLPDTIPFRELEKILQLNSFAYWLKKDDKIYVFFGGLGGKPDEYYRPTKFIVANPYLKFYESVEVNEKGVLMWNDYSHMGLGIKIRRYAELMAECDITLRFGLINERLVSIFVAGNDTVKDSAQAVIDDVVKGKKLGIITGESLLDENGALKVHEYRKANTQDLKAVMELQQYLKASFYNSIGLQANYNMKRESINDSEAGMNEESLKPLIDDMLDSRKEAIKRINEQFGLNITVELNSAWIRRKEIPSDETKDITPNEEEKPEETTKEKTEESEEVKND